ncbi:hypothetical protein LV78_002046 [Actinosynnema pretiosum]|nr:hypothetical protein [Actinosynnema pretiosum]
MPRRTWLHQTRRTRSHRPHTEPDAPHHWRDPHRRYPRQRPDTGRASTMNRHPGIGRTSTVNRHLDAARPVFQRHEEQVVGARRLGAADWRRHGSRSGTTVGAGRQSKGTTVGSGAKVGGGGNRQGDGNRRWGDRRRWLPAAGPLSAAAPRAAIGGGATVCGGVAIGDGTAVGGGQAFASGGVSGVMRSGRGGGLADRDHHPLRDQLVQVGRGALQEVGVTRGLSAGAPLPEISRTLTTRSGRWWAVGRTYGFPAVLTTTGNSVRSRRSARRVADQA